MPSTNHEGTQDKYEGDAHADAGTQDAHAEKCPNPRIRRGRSCSTFTQESNKITNDQTDRVPSTNHEGTQDKEAIASRSCSGNVHDVFEVPQTSERHEVSDVILIGGL